MDKLEELLPGIDDYLCNFLAKEKLSSLAERKRLYYVDRLDQYRLQPPSQPPSLPPRPLSGLPNPKIHIISRPTVPLPSVPTETVSNGATGSIEDFAAKQREIARQQKVAGGDLDVVPPVPPREHDINEEENLYSDANDVDGCYSFYDDVQLDPEDITDNIHNHHEEDVYEVPLNHEDDLCRGSSHENLDQTGDESSATSYESYDEDEPSPLPAVRRLNEEDIPLPRIRSKKKKKKKENDKEKDIKDKDKGKDSDAETGARTLKNVTFFGDLFHKGKISWAKRYCVISDRRLLVYHSEKDIKPKTTLPLVGFDVTYLEKEGKRNHVLRISHPGMETHWFSTETKEGADGWLKALSSATTLSELRHSNSTSSLDNVSPIEQRLSDKEKSPSVDNLTTSSNNSSNTVETKFQFSEDTAVYQGTNAIPITVTNVSEGSEAGDKSADESKTKLGAELDPNTPKSKKQPSKSLTLGQRASKFLGTFGKKRGKKTLSISTSFDLMDTMSFDAEAGDTDVTMAGHLNIKSELRENPDWSECWCLIRTGLFECYSKSSDETPEFVFPLFGCEINQAPETGKELAIKITQGDSEKAILEASNTLRQGRWLTKLIKETGCGLSPPGGMYDESEEFSLGPNGGDVYEEAVPATEDNENANNNNLDKGSDDEDYVYDDIEQITRTVSRPGDTSEDIYERAYEQTYDDLSFGTESETSERYMEVDDLSKIGNGDVISGDRPSVSSLSAKFDKNANIQGTKRNGNNNHKVEGGSTGITPSSSRSSSVTSSPRDSPWLQRKGSNSQFVKKGDFKDIEELLEEISYVKKRLGQLKRKRTAVRDKKIQSRKPSDKKKYEEEYKEIDKEFSTLSKDLNDLEKKLEEFTKNKDLKPVPLRRPSSSSSIEDVVRRRSSSTGDDSKISQITLKLTNSKEANTRKTVTPQIRGISVKQKIQETEAKSKSTGPSPRTQRKVFIKETIKANTQANIKKKTESTTEYIQKKNDRSSSDSSSTTSTKRITTTATRSISESSGTKSNTDSRPLSGYTEKPVSVQQKLKEWESINKK